MDGEGGTGHPTSLFLHFEAETLSRGVSTFLRQRNPHLLHNYEQALSFFFFIFLFKFYIYFGFFIKGFRPVICLSCQNFLLSPAPIDSSTLREKQKQNKNRNLLCARQKSGEPACVCGVRIHRRETLPQIHRTAKPAENV